MLDTVDTIHQEEKRGKVRTVFLLDPAERKAGTVVERHGHPGCGASSAQCRVLAAEDSKFGGRVMIEGEEEKPSLKPAGASSGHARKMAKGKSVRRVSLLRHEARCRATARQ